MNARAPQPPDAASSAHRGRRVSAGTALAALFSVLFLLPRCGGEPLVRGRAFDFLARLKEAEAERRGVILPPLDLPHAETFLTGEARLVCPVPPGTVLRFRHVPVGPGAELTLGCGLTPGRSPRKREGKIRFQVELQAGGRTFTLLDRTVPVSELADAGPLQARIPLPPAALQAGEGTFLFRTDASRGVGARLPAWYGPLLRSRGIPPAPEERSVTFFRPAFLLLDGAVEGEGKAPAGRRVNYDEEAGRLLPHPRGRLLLVTPPARARFRVRPPPVARLTLGLAVPGGGEGAPAALRFTVRAAGKTLLEETLSTADGGAARRFHLPLPRPAGGETEIELAVTPEGREGGAAQALWIDPVVEERCTVPRRRAGEGRNLLLLVVDALRADHTSLLGYSRDTTPHLARRARNGTVFTRALAQSSWTVPSTATLLTGLYSYTHGLYDAYHWYLVPGTAGLPHAFRAAGCATAAFVSNPLVAEDPNFAAGFESFQAFPYATAAQLNGAFLHWLEDHRGERFFAYLHYMEPHLPYAAPPPFYGRFLSPRAAERSPDPARSVNLAELLDERLRERRGKGFPDLRGTLGEEERPLLRELEDLYDGAVAYWDDRLEALLRALEERGVLENTVVVITADHGEEFLEHGRLRHGQSLFRELLHVPLVILDPDRPPCRRADPAGLVDLAPTLLARLGIPPPPAEGTGAPPPFQGRDLFSGPEAERFLFAETAHGLAGAGEAMVTERAVIRGTRKGILLLTEPPRFLLFDLASDPGEARDRAALEPEAAARLRDSLERWVKRCRARAPYNVSLLDAAAAARLKELGYVK